MTEVWMHSASGCRPLVVARQVSVIRVGAGGGGGGGLSTNPHSSLHDDMYNEVVTIALQLGGGRGGGGGTTHTTFTGGAGAGGFGSGGGTGTGGGPPSWRFCPHCGRSLS